jgi:hypothetical protein
MKNINSIGIIIYTNGNIKETKYSNYINSKTNMISKALSLTTPRILLDEKYKLFIIIENIQEKNYNQMANHIISMLKTPSIFNYGCIYGNCYIFNENKRNIIDFTKKNVTI